MDLQKVIKEEVLPALEVAVKKYEAQINAKVDAALDAAFGKLAEAIPGKFDDGLIAAELPKIKELVHQYLAKLEDQISDQV